MAAQSLIAFDSFIQGLTSTKKNRNNSVVFNATVEYSWRGRSETEALEVRAANGGVEHGNITVQDGEELTSDLVHLDFDLNYQEYALRGNSLVISGKSPKMGSYQVVLTEA